MYHVLNKLCVMKRLNRICLVIILTFGLFLTFGNNNTLQFGSRVVAQTGSGSGFDSGSGSISRAKLIIEDCFVHRLIEVTNPHTGETELVLEIRSGRRGYCKSSTSDSDRCVLSDQFPCDASFN